MRRRCSRGSSARRGASCSRCRSPRRRRARRGRGARHVAWRCGRGSRARSCPSQIGVARRVVAALPTPTPTGSCSASCARSVSRRGARGADAAAGTRPAGRDRPARRRGRCRMHALPRGGGGGTLVADDGRARVRRRHAQLLRSGSTSSTRSTRSPAPHPGCAHWPTRCSPPTGSGCRWVRCWPDSRKRIAPRCGAPPRPTPVASRCGCCSHWCSWCSPPSCSSRSCPVSPPASVVCDARGRLRFPRPSPQSVPRGGCAHVSSVPGVDAGTDEAAVVDARRRARPVSRRRSTRW